MSIHIIMVTFRNYIVSCPDQCNMLYTSVLHVVNIDVTCCNMIFVSRFLLFECQSDMCPEHSPIEVSHIDSVQILSTDLLPTGEPFIIIRLCRVWVMRQSRYSDILPKWDVEFYFKTCNNSVILFPKGEISFLMKTIRLKQRSY